MTILLWIKTRALLLAGIAVGLLSIVWKIRRSGRDAERLKSAEATIKAIKKKDEVKNEIVRMPDGAAADRLRNEWSRD
jgi:hypothetical protein